MLNTPLPFPDEWTPGSVPPALIRFKHSWEAFIDSLVREWKTLNVVSALLASAILTMFQIPQAADDPITRTGALMSLMCGLLSLVYGCMYIVRFGQMRSMFHASRWAEQAGKTKTLIWWNVWVLLAMPAIWLAWAMLWFMGAILSFVWRTGSVNDPDDRAPLGEVPALITRILITSVLALGMVYLVLIIRTLKKYGSHQGSARSLLPSVVNRDTNANEGGNAGQMNSGREASPRKKGAWSAEMADMQKRGRAMDRHISEPYPSRGRQEKIKPNRRSSGLKGLFGSNSPAKNESKAIQVEMDVKLKHDVDVVVNDLTK
ncbi:hypothetical protein CPB83DRAFT_809825 [Crepidotus variabilis]|uniref:Uncharacterized protein n=1 Tax=Crepidotus variabilis TaxID=179855 RepID=A0A9P6EJL1_9AGAR|nr:hypothetical protein CPB83DRAFT_809825 [Crepidotus variabilis]